MTEFDEELAQLRAEVTLPDAAETQRVASRLSRSIGTLTVGDTSPVPRAFPWARPLQLATSFAVGGIVGAGVYGALGAPRIEHVYVERPLASSELPVTSVTNPAPEVAPPEVAPPGLPSSRSLALKPTASAAGERPSTLAEQQALLDVARAAFARNDYVATLQALAAHSARFPKSLLSEEREALEIKALAASDRLQEARTLAARFRARHPQSLLLPSIKDSVGTIP